MNESREQTNHDTIYEMDRDPLENESCTVRLITYIPPASQGVLPLTRASAFIKKKH